jgi:hypothetical protein
VFCAERLSDRGKKELSVRTVSVTRKKKLHILPVVRAPAGASSESGQKKHVFRT